MLVHNKAAYTAETPNPTVGIVGHHYDCGKFSQHTIKMNGHTLCAACTGLFLGGIGALLGTLVYFFLGIHTEQLGFQSVAVGVAAMTLGFLEMKFGGLARLILNVLFVLGGFLILAGLDVLKESLLIDLLSIVLIVFWVFTRILLSQWNHWVTCKKCPIACEAHDSTK